MKDEIDILRIQFADERASYRKREAFLSSVILHLLLIIFILVSPKLFPRSLDRNARNADLARLEQQRQQLELDLQAEREAIRRANERLKELEAGRATQPPAKKPPEGR